ncbi:MAG: thermosome subunit beta, partial [Patescibacteria group bacterium]|nr:thermosome subunit beta [Patescibacteria group bacterium]
GELLKQVEHLLEKNIHPTIIVNGDRMASIKAQEILESLAEKIELNDKKMLEKIAMTAMTGKSAEMSMNNLAKMLVEAIGIVTEIKDKTIFIDREALKIEKKTGGKVDDSELIQGIIIDKERIHPDMPRVVENAKILLLDAALEVKETESDTQIRITSPDQLQAFLEREETNLKEMVNNVLKIQANVIFCEKGIDDSIQYMLAKKGIFAARRVKRSDMEKLAKATGAKIINNLEEIEQADLGFAGLVEQKKIGGEEMTFVEKCKHPKSVTILLRGGTEHVIDEIERAIIDAIGDIISVIKDGGRIIAGGGSAEMELSKQLIKYSNSLSGREQMAIRAYATAMEIIPRTLAENAGIDSLDVLTNLKTKHDDKDGKNYGLNVFTGRITDMKELNVIEPLKIKTQAISGATEAAMMILRIDDVIARGPEKPSGPQGMPPGMPPMDM